MKTFYFNTDIPFAIYDTDNEVDMIDDSDSEDPIPHPKLMWQEGKARCAKCKAIISNGNVCPVCDSKELIPIEPIYFETWEEADAFGQKFWEKKVKDEQIEDIED